MSQSRIQWVDTAKGIGIILVIIGHMGNIPEWLWVFIESFHMALFFFVAGVTFNGEVGFITFLKRRGKSIVIPYLCLGILYTPVQLALAGDNYNLLEVIGEYAKELLVVQRKGHYWFIGALFWANIIYYLINRYITNSYIKITVSAVCFGIGYYYTKNFPCLPWNINIAFTAVIFFCVGNIYRKSDLYSKKIKFSYLKAITLIVLWISLFTFYYSNGGETNFYSAYWGYMPFSIMLALLGVAVVVYFSINMQSKTIQYIGKNSMVYYMWQWIGFSVAYKAYLIMFPNLELDGIYLIYDFVITMAVLTICSCILNSSRLRFLLGKY